MWSNWVNTWKLQSKYWRPCQVIQETIVPDGLYSGCLESTITGKVQGIIMERNHASFHSTVPP